MRGQSRMLQLKMIFKFILHINITSAFLFTKYEIPILDGQSKVMTMLKMADKVILYTDKLYTKRVYVFGALKYSANNAVCENCFVQV